ncbi:flagellar biosynthesis regulator FlaF [Pararhodobacter sp. CCB-MM2]|uniref:flagellar biosynthesis regulator FlaF n=1 Tax=Pararhodobacter sp. CCB-MM2 TaxID=1786003 RepID=UPI00082FCD2C|nr:flagellar biosynthesis regulator FlaF [Pararhodobacter sp. CCB-MM2]MCA2011973.1 flagellar biosynthesis regulator FlaF [Cereibacter sphaeroides]
MSYAAHARTSYGHSNAQAIKTPRDIEYEVMARITGRIQSHLPKPGERVSGALAEALNENRRLWASFATDLAHPDNGLPQDLRGRLFYLAEFTMKHTAQVLLGKASAAVLAEINMAVMRGLRGQGAR